MSEWKTFKGEILGDPEARAVYDARKPAYELASKLIALRKKLWTKTATGTRRRGPGEVFFVPPG